MRIAYETIGFGPVSAQAVGHYRLMMHELEKALPGELNVDISLGQGTPLNFRIPLVHLQESAHLPFCSHI